MRLENDRTSSSVLIRPRELLRSLDTPEARERQHMVDSPWSSTYGWVFEDDIGFNQWLGNPQFRKAFWIWGKPGSGKSTLMKFMMNHPLVPQLLRGLSPMRWVTAGFFFHDRGFINQKTTVSLLREILYQILQQRHDLVATVARVFLEKLVTRPIRGKEATWDATDIDNAFDNLDQHRSITWRAQDVRQALRMISKYSPIPVNVCLFVDALDEHSGDHMELVEILLDLAEPELPTQLRVKLCVASREENLLRDAFSRSPNFAIHDHTASDIRKYAYESLKRSYFQQVSIANVPGLADIVDEILVKAEGVFIWVKLVVNELAEGLRDGDTIAELRELLSSLPSELRDLYHRAFVRGSEQSTQSTNVQRQRREAYVMLQIAACARQTFSLTEFVTAAYFLSSSEVKYEEAPKLTTQMTVEEMGRRLRARCRGLLEIVGKVSKRTSLGVQFVHQTAKEFAIQDPRMKDMLHKDDKLRHENGHVLLQRYYISLICSGSESHVHELGYHAFKAETSTGLSWTPDLQYLLEKNMLIPTVMILKQCKLTRLFRSVLEGTNDSRFWLLIIGVVFNLTLYLEAEVARGGWMIRTYAGRLLTAILWAPSNTLYPPSAGFERVVQKIVGMSEANTSPIDLSFKGNQPLQNLFLRLYHTEGAAFQGYGMPERSESADNNDMSILGTLLRHGADPNESIDIPNSSHGRALSVPPLIAVTENPTSKLGSRHSSEFLYMEALIEYGADPSGTDSSGNTALFYAIRQNDRYKVEQLVQYRADPTRLTSSGLNFWSLSPKAFPKSQGPFENFESKYDAMKTIINAFSLTNTPGASKEPKRNRISRLLFSPFDG